MRVAIFVDAGYLYAEGSKPLSPNGVTPLHWVSVALDQDGVIAKLVATAAEKTDDAPLLRIYWYDGVLPQGLSAEQRKLASTDNVKFRLGIVNPSGQPQTRGFSDCHRHH